MMRIEMSLTMSVMTDVTGSEYDSDDDCSINSIVVVGSDPDRLVNKHGY
jgi:hypothetical protein